MNAEEVQSLGAIPSIVMVTLFVIAFVLVCRHNRRLHAKARADWMERRRKLPVLPEILPAGQSAFVPVGTDPDSGSFGQGGAMRFTADTSTSMGTDQHSWIDTQDWTAVNPCAIGGPGPGNNFGHSAGLAGDGFSDR